MTDDPFAPPKGIGVFKFRFLLWKRYFDTGLSVTGYVKYLIAFFGVASSDVRMTLVLGIIYGMLCFVIGYAWYRYDFVEANNEIDNRFNRFVREMRQINETKK